jgi:hypothetical protein
MFQVQIVEKIKTHFIFDDFFSEKHAVCEIMWKNTLEQDWPQMTM